LAFHFGTREHKNLDELLALLKPFDIKVAYTDNDTAYQSRDTNSKVVTDKKTLKRLRENTYH
jgi:IS1 family transposase